MSGPWIVALMALWVLLTVVGVGLLGLIRVWGAGGPPREVDPVSSLTRLRIGERPADFEAVSVAGEPTNRDSLRGGCRTVLISQVGCPPCRRILDDIAATRPAVLGAHLLVVVDDARSVLAEHRRSGATFLVDRAGSVARAFGVHGAPIAFLLDDGEVAKILVPAGLRDVLALSGERPLGDTSRTAV